MNTQASSYQRATCAAFSEANTKAGCLPLFLQRFIGSLGLKQFQAIWRLAGLSLGLQAATLDEELAAVQKNKEAKVTAHARWYNGNLCSKNMRMTL